MTKTAKLKINNVKGHAGTATIQIDENGIPLDKFWRKRLRDAEIDNCVEIVKAKRSTTKEIKSDDND